MKLGDLVIYDSTKDLKSILRRTNKTNHKDEVVYKITSMSSSKTKDSLSVTIKAKAVK